MKLEEMFGLGRPQMGFDPNAPIEQLEDTLQDLRTEMMFEENPRKQKQLQQQIDQLTALVAEKTARPKRDAWSPEDREAFRQQARQRHAGYKQRGLAMKGRM